MGGEGFVTSSSVSPNVDDERARREAANARRRCVRERFAVLWICEGRKLVREDVDAKAQGKGWSSMHAKSAARARTPRTTDVEVQEVHATAGEASHGKMMVMLCNTLQSAFLDADLTWFLSMRDVANSCSYGRCTLLSKDRVRHQKRLEL